MTQRSKNTLLGLSSTGARRIKNLALTGALAVLAVLLSGVTAHAQPGQTGQQQGGQQQTALSSQTSWQDSLQRARQENEALRMILSSIESIDTARQNQLIQWIITDRNIRSRVISALRKGGYRIAPNSVAELTVTQKPPTGGEDPDQEMQLLRLVIESVGIYGEPNIRRVLGPALYDQIRYRQGYEYTLVSTEPAQQKIQFVAMNASLFGGSIIFKSGFGFAINVGNDWIGYPFWLPGTIGTYGLLRRGTTDFRIGLEWPLGQTGIQPFNISGGGLRIKERKLTGSMAFSAQILQELDLLSEQSGKLHFGLEFLNAFTPTINNFPQYDYGATSPYRTGTHGVNGATDSLYYIALSAHGYVSYRLPESILRGAYVQVGAGTHSIQPVTIGLPNDLTHTSTDLNLTDRKNFFDPFLKVGYVHTSESGDDYGVSVQYSNTLLTDAWVKLFPWLELEAKYSTVVFRDPQPWEWKDYVMVSPKLTLNF